MKKFKAENAPVKYLKGEEWTRLKINSRNLYLISTKGRIYSYWSDRCLNFSTRSGVHTFDYSPVDGNTPLGENGLPRKIDSTGRVTLTVCRLVAVTFLVKPRGSLIAAHVTSDILDDSVSNVKWLTRSETLSKTMSLDNFKNAMRSSGAGHKLTREQVIEMKELLAKKRRGETDISIKGIAKKYGIAEMNVYRIQNGDLWGDVGTSVKEKEVPYKNLTDYQAASIKKLLNKGLLTGREIATKFGIDPSLVSKIKRGKAYGEVQNSNQPGEQ